jgi:hypothetical protein
MTMSSFRVTPRQGNLNRVKRIYGYLSKMKFATIRVRTEEPDYSDLPEREYDWARSIYGNVKEAIPHDVPALLGKRVIQTTLVDANPMHNLNTGRAVTGVLHLLSQPSIDWLSRKQPTVETATYGSKFVAARTAVQQIIELRLMLRYLGVPPCLVTTNPLSRVDPFHTPSWTSVIMPCLSYHFVREAITSGMVRFGHIPGPMSVADILRKHWGYQQVWPLLKPLLFWQGDTSILIEDDSLVQSTEGEGEDIPFPDAGFRYVDDEGVDNAGTRYRRRDQWKEMLETELEEHHVLCSVQER